MGNRVSEAFLAGLLVITLAAVAPRLRSPRIASRAGVLWAGLLSVPGT